MTNKHVISRITNGFVLVSKILLGSFIVCAPLFAADPPKSKAVIAEKVFDFGTVTEGTKVVHDFTVKNEGDGDLVIQRVVPACGCTAASSSADPIKPGTEGKIHVEFDSSGFSGEKLKTVRVLTNDFDNLSMVLSLKGTIISDVMLEPQSVFFDESVRGASTEANAKIVQVKVRAGSNIKINSVKSFSHSLVVKELSTEDGVTRISIGIDPEAPLGELRDRVIVGLSGGKEASLNIPVFASVQGQLILKPSQLSFGIVEGTEPLKRAVQLENRGSTPIKISDVKSNNPAVTASIKEIQAGKNFVLQITVDPTKVNRDLRAAVELSTDNPQEPSISLNIFGILPPKV